MPRTKRVAKELVRLWRGEPKITPGAIDDTTLLSLIGSEASTILDVGSNDGGHTLRFLRLFSNAKIYSFEPDPRACRRYRQQVQDPRAELFEIAISDTDGSIEFHVSGGQPPWAAHIEESFAEGWDLSGSIKKPKLHVEMMPWCTFDEKITVATKRLDTWAREYGVERADFVWADVQGAEAELISGGRQLLSRTRYFYTEYSNSKLYEGQVNLNRLLQLLRSSNSCIVTSTMRYCATKRPPPVRGTSRRAR